MNVFLHFSYSLTQVHYIRYTKKIVGVGRGTGSEFR
jgi:hypothetical protein